MLTDLNGKIDSDKIIIETLIPHLNIYLQSWVLIIPISKILSVTKL